MSGILDWMLIIIGTICAIHSLNSIIKNKNSSTAHFIILVEYIICCFPILCNYILGYPHYETIYWYKVFISSMHDKMVCILYDVYILLSVVLLELYAVYYDKTKSMHIERKDMRFKSLLQNRVLLIVCIFSPIIYVVLSGNISYFSTYGVRSSRYATDSSIGRITSMLILLSIYAFFFYFFTSKRKRLKIPVTIVYIFVITWLQGKRFILVIIGVVFLFYYTKNGLNRKQQRMLRRILPFVAIGIIAFSYWYLVYVRPMSNSSLESIYDMLRVDLGRDDVIKYVIEKVIIDKEKIVPYNGSTFLSTFLFFVPRVIWKMKPYPHYVYLTASILNLPIMDIPAGTTPSWFEMSIANFGVFGFLFGIVSIPLLCMGMDRLKEITHQLISVVLVCALLTQNIDAYLTFVLVFVVQFIMRKVIGRRRVIVSFGRKKIFVFGEPVNQFDKNIK